MKYFSTLNKNEIVSFKDAVLNGTAKNGGLFLPFNIPSINFNDESNYHELAFNVLKNFTNEDLTESELHEIIINTFNFPVKIASFENEHFLELFHGPTLAFKDFGARFLANLIEKFNKDSDSKLNILVATSGDTGSAVANAFYEREGVNVIVLYPSKGVSDIQEKQISTYDKNIISIEVEGSFDDCQALLKHALNDEPIKNEFKLTTANSINIARLLPQTIYYFEALRQLKLQGKTLVTVPSGNLGNLTAGILSKLMGQKIDGFISAVNKNDFFQKYLETGNEARQKTIKTFSNAMDVGLPNNLNRIKSIYNSDRQKMNEFIDCYSVDDTTTIETIKKIYDKLQYVADPHTAVGYQASQFKKSAYDNSIILSTAHPAKFKDVIEKTLKLEVELPEQLSRLINKEKRSIKIKNDYKRFIELLRDNSSLLK